jgi:hypothetical protein
MKFARDLASGAQRYANRLMKRPDFRFGRIYDSPHLRELPVRRFMYPDLPSMGVHWWKLLNGDPAPDEYAMASQRDG